MRIRLFSLLSLTAVLGAMLPVAQAPARVSDQPAASCSLAGYGYSDATFPVGNSAGQYASTHDPSGDVDPHAQQVKNHPSYGVESRLNVRALVVQGCDGKTIALVKTDHYLSQDAVQRRVGQILEERGSVVGYEDTIFEASHNHNSPYQVTPSWGVWAFQDAFDARAFEFFARQAADAILEAEANLQPARMGATEVHHEIYKANVPGPGNAHDKTPSGYPRTFGDHEVVVMRFDNATTGDPIGTWVNWGQHPESLKDHDLITGDYIAPLERMVRRETGSEMVFSQGDVGSSEGPDHGWPSPTEWLPDGTKRVWRNVGFAQLERGARYLADSIVEGFNEIGSGRGTVPYSTDFAVGSYNGWIPLPKSHPYPSVSNCRSEATAEGSPGAPVVGLPDCARAGENGDPNNVLWENLKAHGLPIPEHYDAPAFTGVEENMRLRLQAFRLGDVILGSCSCEAQVDLILNFESRVDDVVGNLNNGYEWKCTRPGFDPTNIDPDPLADHDWACEDPDGGPGATKAMRFSDYEYVRMLAHVNNNAAGWDDPEYLPFANTEPADVSQIKGNFTFEELGGTGAPIDDENVLPTEGYKLAVGIGHAGDYTGYTVSYREYMNTDEYRKALTCCGPHTADYMSTNLVYMAETLKNPAIDRLADNPYNQAQAADEARQVAFTTALGQSTSAAYDAWRAALPADKGAGQIVEQPKDIERFDAAQFTWTGGSSVVDSPMVTVQRLSDGNWVDYADQSGEVQMFLEYPDGFEGFQGAVDTYRGEKQWTWTANFEAFDSGPRIDIDHRGPQTPEGDYRFVIKGTSRKALTEVSDPTARDVSYELTSDPFTVSKWTGIKVQDFRADDGDASFTVTGVTQGVKTTIAPGLPEPQIRYPRTYNPPDVIRWIRDDGQPDICRTCSFRPWATGADVASASVTILRADATTETVPATLGDDGRFHAAVVLGDGDEAYVAPGGVVDTYGETNGQASQIASITATGSITSGTGDSPVDIFGGLTDLISAWGAQLR